MDAAALYGSHAQNRDETIRHILQSKGLLHEEEKYECEKDFFSETAGINERLKELGTEPNPEELERCEEQTKNLLNAIDEKLASDIKQYQEGIASEKELLQMKDGYYRKKYLQRILDRIYQIRNIASHF